MTDFSPCHGLLDTNLGDKNVTMGTRSGRRAAMRKGTDQ